MPGIPLCKLIGNQPTSITCSQDCRPSFSKIPGHGIQLNFEKSKMNGKMNFSHHTGEGNGPNRTSETKCVKMTPNEQRDFENTTCANACDTTTLCNKTLWTTLRHVFSHDTKRFATKRFGPRS